MTAGEAVTRNASTRATCPLHIWRYEVESATIAAVGVTIPRVGHTGDWLRSDAIHRRLVAAYQAGEPVWMVADEMRLRANDARVEAAATSDGRAALRAAVRAAHR